MELSQKQYDEIVKKLRILSFQQQKANDLFEGGLTSRNLASFRNTYVINAQDSLDVSYPMYVHFNILDEMIKIVSVKVDFWILNYRAYSTAATEKEAVTSGPSSAESSASGGGETPTSSSGGSSTPTTSSGGSSTPTTSSGGGQTSSASSASGSSGYKINAYSIGHNVGDENIDGAIITSIQTGANFATATHTHTVDDHTHTVTIVAHTHTVTIVAHTHTVTIVAHTHDIPHTHNIPAHNHDITYGIHEEETSPTIKFYVSENAGISYSDVFGGYDVDKSEIDITSWLTRAGSKLIKFASDVRARLSVQIEIKLDIKAR